MKLHTATYNACDGKAPMPKPKRGSGKDERTIRNPPPVKAKPERKPTPARQRFRLLARDKFACVYCGAPGGSVRPDGSTVVLDIDHRVSIADGGDESDENKCAACEKCNGGKGRKSVVKVTRVDKGPIQAQLARVKKPA